MLKNVHASDNAAYSQTAFRLIAFRPSSVPAAKSSVWDLSYSKSNPGNHSSLFRRLAVLFHHRLRAIYQLNKSHGRLVTRTETTLEDPDIAARPLLVSRAQFLKKFTNRCLGASAVKRQSAVGNVILLGQRN